MNLARRWTAALAVLLAALLLSACATPPRTTAPTDATLGPWSGRLAVQVADKPDGSFSASFELRGNARDGELSLFSPLGGTLGVVRWEPGKAVLQTGSRTSEYGSLQELMTQVAGAPIPIAALFDWLRGIDTPVPGWQVNLSQLADGRLSAKRYTPPPEADLRVVLEH
jgi:outer membrane lipoprotein LolB